MDKISKAIKALEDKEKAVSRFCMTNVKLVLESNGSWKVNVSDLFLKSDYDINGDDIESLNKWAEETLNEKCV